ncbi:hypothetical protein COLO4_12322 [Corchorus olitorius]|uniref:Retrotransposon gag protein n=1 Tax=Corchorus olitorius TaxID=93759 RepID=A0A1R3K186_9ROSI|nr:hypothetical protein COLO4_12322 [Corchorus olitorius]
MGDWRSFQQQFETFLKLYEADREKDRQDREQDRIKQQELAARLEEISREVSTGKREERVDGEGSVNRGRRDKRPFGGDVQDTTSFVPKYTKLDFPKYDGSYDPLGWIHRCEHFFRHQNTPEEEKVGLASFHLEGNAQLWFLKLERDHPAITWDAFAEQ